MGVIITSYVRPGMILQVGGRSIQEEKPHIHGNSLQSPPQSGAPTYKNGTILLIILVVAIG